MRISVVLLTVIVLVSCRATYTQKENKCISSWEYKNLETEQRIQILLFSPKHRIDVSSFPNFLIGINSIGDTIGYIDVNYDKLLDKGKFITVQPTKYDNAQQLESLMKGQTNASRSDKINKLFCSVKTVYYVKITP